MKLRRQRWGILLLACMGLAGCVSVEFEGADERLPIVPADLATEGARVPRGTVVWGGRILQVQNLESGTELLILAQPLTSGNVPRTERASVGRFVAHHQDYLEPMDFAPGRYVSLAGTLTGTTGEWSYEGTTVNLPLVELRQIHLWPRDQSSWQNQLNFGLSIGIWH